MFFSIINHPIIFIIFTIKIMYAISAINKGKSTTTVTAITHSILEICSR